jgi:hypothetical protein
MFKIMASTRQYLPPKRPLDLDGLSVTQESKRLTLSHTEYAEGAVHIEGGLHNSGTNNPIFIGNPTFIYHVSSSDINNSKLFEPIWDPQFPPRNPYFVGRKEVLTLLATTLHSKGIGVINQAVSVGMGGIGKTEVAKEFAHQNRDKYGLVWWIRAGSSVTLLEDYRRLARSLEVVDPDEMKIIYLIDDVKVRLQKRGGFLLVFDNAETEAGGIKLSIQDFFSENGDILVTSRDQSWIDPIRVPVFELEDIKNYFSRVFGSSHTHQMSDIFLLSEMLGYLPLAIIQAVGYLKEEQGSTISEYVHFFENIKQKILSRGTVLTQHVPVAVTFDITMEKIKTINPGARELLIECSFLAPDPIPKFFVSEWVAQKYPSLSTVEAEWTVKELLSVLKRYSMISDMPREFSIHRLILCITSGLVETHNLSWMCLVKIFFHLFNYNKKDMGTLPICTVLYPHILELNKRIPTSEADWETAGKLFSKVASLYGLGTVQLHKGHYEAALQLFNSDLEIQLATFGSQTHPEIANTFHTIGEAYFLKGDYSKALQNFKTSLNIQEHVYKTRVHAWTADTLHWLGKTCRALNLFEESEVWFLESLNSKKRVYSEGNPEILKTKNELDQVNE